MSQIARDTGLSRESLFKTLSRERALGFDTIIKLVQALGLKVHAAAAGKGESHVTLFSLAKVVDCPPFFALLWCGMRGGRVGG